MRSNLSLIIRLAILPIFFLGTVSESRAQEISGGPSSSYIICIGGNRVVSSNHQVCDGGYSVINEQWCVNGTWKHRFPNPPTCSSNFILSRDYIVLLETYRHRTTTQEKLTRLTEQVDANTSAMLKMQEEIKNSNILFVKEVQEMITKRFASIPAELLNNPAFKDELERLRKQIMEEVEAIVTTKQEPPN